MQNDDNWWEHIDERVRLHGTLEEVFATISQALEEAAGHHAGADTQTKDGEPTEYPPQSNTHV